MRMLWRMKVRSPCRLLCVVVSMRTSRVTVASAALLGLVVLARGPSLAAAEPATCAPPGPPAACVVPEDGASTTTLAPDEPVVSNPGPALWVGAAFGIAGLAGIVFANARVVDPEPAAEPQPEPAE